jgi:hypothetical protein
LSTNVPIAEVSGNITMMRIRAPTVTVAGVTMAVGIAGQTRKALFPRDVDTTDHVDPKSLE